MVHQSEQLHWSLKCGASEPEKQQNIVTIYKQQYHWLKDNFTPQKMLLSGKVS